MNTIVVVGASLAGLSAARALRGAGFDGRLVVIGDEKHDPYDRPPLSKDFLAGRQQVADLALTIPPDADLKIEWRLGQRATGLRPLPDGYRIELADAEPVDGDGVVIATGARARLLPGSTGALRGVHTLRTLDDALALRAELVAGARLVVVGGGFIGAEIASTARELGVEVTLVELAPTALAGPLGEELGAVFAALHVARGVEVLTGVRVESLVPGTDEAVAAVRLADGRELPADVVLVGIGSIPNTEWLAGSGVLGAGPDGDLAAGVAISDGGATSLPGVVATGDGSPTGWSGTSTGRTRCSTRRWRWPPCSADPRPGSRSPPGCPTSGPTSTGCGCSSPGTTTPVTRSRSSRAMSPSTILLPFTGGPGDRSRSSASGSRKSSAAGASSSPPTSTLLEIPFPAKVF